MNDEILTHEEALVLLSEKARAGSVTALVALERALRLSGRHQENIDDAFDRLLGEAPAGCDPPG